MGADVVCTSALCNEAVHISAIGGVGIPRPSSCVFVMRLILLTKGLLQAHSVSFEI